MKKSTKVTILDVANAAGVSTATVSRVINNPDKVKKNTIKLVYDAMSKVGYESKLLDPPKKKLNIILVVADLDTFCTNQGIKVIRLTQ